MTEFFIFLAYVFLFYLFLKRKELEILKFKITKLEEELKKLKNPNQTEIINSPQVLEKDNIVQPVETNPKKETLVTPIQINSEKESLETNIIRPAFKDKAEIQKPIIQEKINQKTESFRKQDSTSSSIFDFWKKIEKPLVENWTGILGAIIVVIGVGFLGIYGGLIATAFIRFLMILGLSIFFYFISYYTKTKLNWVALSSYLQSISAAIFLFSCLGSFSIEGLKWIDSLPISILMIILGISYNLFIGILSKKQFFLSLHTILALISFSFLPNSLFTLPLATITLLISIYKNFTEKWDSHLLTVLTGYFFLSLYILDERRLTIDSSYTERLFSMFCIILVFTTGLVVHYKNIIYEKLRIEILSILTHLTSWFYFGILLLLLSTGNKWNSIVLGLASIGLFIFSNQAQKKEIQWLYFLDKLISLILSFIFAISLTNWELTKFTIVILLSAETLVFAYFIFKENSKSLLNISLGINFTLSLFYIILLALSSSDTTKTSFINITVTSFYTIFALLILNLIQYEEKITIKLKEGIYFLLGLSVFFLLFFFKNIFYINIIASIVFVLFLYWKEKKQLNGFFYGILFSISFNFLNTIYSSQTYLPKSIFSYLIFTISSLASYIALIRFSYIEKLDRKLSALGNLFLVAQIFFIIKDLVSIESYYYLGMSICIYSILIFEVSKYLNKIDDLKLRDYFYPNLQYIIFTYFFLAYSFYRSIFMEEVFDKNFLEFPIAYTTKVVLFLTVIYFIFRKLELRSKLQKIQILLWEFLLVIVLYSLKYLAPIDLITSFIILGGICYSISKIKILGIQRFEFYTYLLLFSSHFVMLYQVFNLNPEDLYSYYYLSIITILFVISVFLPSYILSSSSDYLSEFLYSEFAILKNYLSYQKTFLYISAFCFAVFVWKLLQIHSNLSIGILWLSMSLIYFESGFLSRHKNLSTSFIHISFVYLIVFIIRHIFVDLQTESYLWILPIKLIIQTYAIAVFYYIYKYSIPLENTYSFKFHKSLIEIILAFIFILIESVIPYNWKLLSYSVISILLFFIAKYNLELRKLLLYSIFIHIYILFSIATIAGSQQTVTNYFFNENWFSSLLSIFTQTVYIYFVYKEEENLTNELKTEKYFLKFSNFLIHKKDWVLFYPLFLAVFLFLFWSFSTKLLTLLWTLLSLGIFILSIILRKKHFRYTSLLLLLFCLIRLVFYDFSSTGTITKAFLFLGVGSILLIMNSLYNKFKDRF
jgi:hypothetical protein